MSLSCELCLIQHTDVLGNASGQFTHVFAFDAPLLDPNWISCHVVTTILDFSVFGCDSMWKTLQRVAKPEVLFHTSVYLGTSGDVYRLRLAPIRRRPNGVDICCCNQAATYLKMVGERVKFRCRQKTHRGFRNFTVPLLPAEDGKRWIGGTWGKDRYLIDIL